jgi:hypothetical protein
MELNVMLLTKSISSDKPKDEDNLKREPKKVKAFGNRKVA